MCHHFHDDAPPASCAPLSTTTTTKRTKRTPPIPVQTPTRVAMGGKGKQRRGRGIHPTIANSHHDEPLWPIVAVTSHPRSASLRLLPPLLPPPALTPHTTPPLTVGAMVDCHIFDPVMTRPAMPDCWGCRLTPPCLAKSPAMALHFHRSQTKPGRGVGQWHAQLFNHPACCRQCSKSQPTAPLPTLHTPSLHPTAMPPTDWCCRRPRQASRLPRQSLR